MNEQKTSTALDTLRAMEKDCPECNGKGVQRYDVGESLSCETCHGSGTIPRFAMMWSYCKHEQISNEVKLTLTVTMCPHCPDTGRFPRTPTSDEIEDALLEMLAPYHQGVVKTDKRFMIYVGVEDSPVIYGTDPRDCRLQALLSLAQGETDAPVRD